MAPPQIQVQAPVRSLDQRMEALKRANDIRVKRAQRPGEQGGGDYWVLDRAQFDRRIAAGEFLEWVDYVGNRYGTLNSEIERLRAVGKAPLLELETDGALRVKARVPSAVTIFVK